MEIAGSLLPIYSCRTTSKAHKRALKNTITVKQEYIYE